MADIKKVMLIAIAAIMSLGFVSCESYNEPTFVGLQYGQTLEYEDLEYELKLDTLVNKLYTVEQKLKGRVVVYDGNQVVNQEELNQDLNLAVGFTSTPNEVYVVNKEDLENISMLSSNAGDEVKTEKNSNGYTLTKAEKEYNFIFNAGEEVKAKAVYESLKHQDKVFNYAKVKAVRYTEYTGSLNDELSNADSLVYDANLYFSVEVVCEGCEEKDGVYAVRVPVRRIYKEAPAEAITTIQDVEHVGQFATRDNELYTVEQYVQGYWVTTLRDKEIGRQLFKYYLNLNALFEVSPTEVKVDSEAKLSEVSLKTTSIGDEVESKENKDEFEVLNLLKEYEFTFNEGEVVKAKTVYEKLIGKEGVYSYAMIKSVLYKKYDAVLNEKQTNEDKKVYDIVLYFDVDVVCEDNAELNETYTVTVSYQRVYIPEKPDTFEIVVENVGYEGEFNTESKRLYTVRQQVNGELVTYKNQTEEVSRESFEKKLNLEALFDISEVVYVDTESQLSEVALAGSSKDGDKVNKTDTNGFTTINRSLNYNFKFNENERVVSSTVYEREHYGEKEFVYSSIDNVSYKNYEAKKNEVKSNADSTVYDIILYFNVRVKRQNVEETRNSSENETIHTVAVPYSRVYKHAASTLTDLLVKKAFKDVKREILSATTEKVSFTEYEVWSLSGEKNAKTISKVLNYGFSSPQNQTVYTTNTNYSTSSNGKVAGSETSAKDGNWTVYTKTNGYSSTADNKVNAFNNKYSYNSQKAVYKNEYYEVEFGYGSWSISEAGSNIGVKSGEKVYNGKTYEVYPYVNNVNYVYDVTTDTYNGAGKSNVEICIEKKIEPSIVPSAWGKILGAGVSAVPADDVRGDFAKKCICIRTEKGAVAIVFDMSSVVPSMNTVLNGYFVEGKFGAEYNSGFYTTSTNRGKYELNKWAPAIAKDLKDRIAYYDGNTCKANVRYTTLQMWNWRDGNYSTVVDGYDFSVSADGTLTIKYEGKTVMSLR